MSTKSNLFSLPTVLCIILAFVGIAYTQQCFLNPPQGPQVIYQDAILPGWDTAGSWTATSNPLATISGQTGSHVLQVSFSGAWSGIELHRENVSTTALDALVFRFRKEDTDPNFVCALQMANGTFTAWKSILPYIPNPSGGFISGQWYSIRILLTDLGLTPGTLIKGVLFETGATSIVSFEGIGIIPSFLKFPLLNRDPYHMRVVSIQDQLKGPGVTAYNGEKGSGTQVCYPSPQQCDQIGYHRTDTFGPFVLPLLAYDEENPVSGGKDVIWYDEHHGYDYAESNILGTSVVATAAGELCVANEKTVSDGTNYWRNPAYCTIYDSATTTSAITAVDPSCTVSPLTQWGCFHGIYVLHYNGSPSGYSSWYVHVQDIYQPLRAQLIANGHVTVGKGDQIATVGTFSHGRTGGVNAHLHFGVKSPNGSRIDPYGDGSPGNLNLLWELRP